MTTCLSCLSAVDRWCHITACLGGARSRDGIYETTLADNEREAVSDLLGYLENVSQLVTRFRSIFFECTHSLLTHRCLAR